MKIGNYELVEIETIEEVEYNDYVYDLTVEDNHSYNIEGIAVHNSACLTTVNTGIGCPALTSNYYAWKAREQWTATKTWQVVDLRNNNKEYIPKLPTILVDGGIKEPGHLVKAIASGADAIIAGRIFAGCKETLAGQTIETIPKFSKESPDPEGKKLFVKYRGMASRSVQEEAGKEHVFVEGDEYTVPYTGKSVCDVVEEYCDGLKSAMSYLGYRTLNELKGSLWNDKTKYILVTPNSHYEGQAHGK